MCLTANERKLGWIALGLKIKKTCASEKESIFLKTGLTEHTNEATGREKSQSINVKLRLLRRNRSQLSQQNEFVAKREQLGPSLSK